MGVVKETWPRLNTLDRQNMNMPIVNAELAIEGQVVDVADDNGWTGLMYASRYCPNQYVIQRLIDSGANVNARNNDGGTPLMVAAGHNNMDVIRTLVLAGADVCMKTINEINAARQAALFNYPEVVEYLIFQMQRRSSKIDWVRLEDSAMDNYKLRGTDTYFRIRHEARQKKVRT